MMAEDVTSLLYQTKLAESIGQARRLILQGAVRINGVPVTTLDAQVQRIPGTIYRVQCGNKTETWTVAIL